jgi:hypothetical protein
MLSPLYMYRERLSHLTVFWPLYKENWSISDNASSRIRSTVVLYLMYWPITGSVSRPVQNKTDRSLVVITWISIAWPYLMYFVVQCTNIPIQSRRVFTTSNLLDVQY